MWYHLGMKPFISLIFLSGGRGRRTGLSTPKQYLPLDGKPIARHSFELFLTLPAIQEVVVVCEEEYTPLFPEANAFALPGDSRQASTKQGLKEVSPNTEFVLIHDAARPFIQKEEVESLIQEGMSVGAATLGVPLKHSLKRVNQNLFVEESVDRECFFEIQTPQLLKRDILQQGLANAEKKGISVTDDVSLVELIGHPVKVVIGSFKNIKITTREDLEHFCSKEVFENGQV